MAWRASPACGRSRAPASIALSRRRRRTRSPVALVRSAHARTRNWQAVDLGGRGWLGGKAREGGASGPRLRRLGQRRRRALHTNLEGSAWRLAVKAGGGYVLADMLYASKAQPR